MSANPWMKWFPSDWRADPKLSACDPMSRYVWMEMVGLMHEAEPYGHLTDAGVAMSDETLSRIIRVPLKAVRSALKELDQRAVYSITDDGIIFSRRMVREEMKARTLRDNGSKGGNPKLKNQRVNCPLDNQTSNQEDKPHIPEARSQRKEETDKSVSFDQIEPEFSLTSGDECAPTVQPKAAKAGKVSFAGDFPADAFTQWYATFPRKVGKGAAEKAFAAIQRSGIATFTELMDGVRRYILTKPARQDFCHPASWLNAKRWLDEDSSPSPSAMPHPSFPWRPGQPVVTERGLPDRFGRPPSHPHYGSSYAA